MFAVATLGSLTTRQLKEFALQGGLGACVAKVDWIADSEDDLMFLSGEKIIVLQYLGDDTYLGYCEGILGKFAARHVHFVELDPRVLDAFHSEIEGTDMVQSSLQDDIPDDVQPYESMKSIDSTSDFSDSSSKASFSSNFSTDYYNADTNGSTSSLSFYAGSLNESSKFGSYMPNSPNRRSQESMRSAVYATGHKRYNTQPPTARSLSLRNSLPGTVGNSSIFEHTPEDYPPYDDDPMTKRNKPARYSLSAVQDRRPARMSSLEADRRTSQQTVNLQDAEIMDSWGFIHKKDTYDRERPKHPKEAMSAMSVYRERERKWLSAMKKMNVNALKKDSKMKKLARLGVPQSLRAQVWQFLAGSSDYKRKGLYADLLARESLPVFALIDHEVQTCYKDHNMFRSESGHGRTELANVLKAYAHYNPSIGYCPGMGQLVGCMLMHMPAEDSFWLLVAIIERYIPGYYSRSLRQMKIDSLTLDGLLEEHLPRVSEVLLRSNITACMYTTEWFLAMFTLSLPWPHVLRIWDVFFMEGAEIFIKISLAIFELSQDRFTTQRHDTTSILNYLLDLPAEAFSPDILLSNAFRFKISKFSMKRNVDKAYLELANVGELPIERELPSNKSFKIKRILGKKQRQNRPIPQWIRMRTDNKINYNAKRRHWRRTKLNL
ncbi:hypothetical protein BZG36_02638 [Bifiguratus adelaidae]|uniref:60S ribosomal protein L39 n=1 Tax=Bifiguratus adelaidae TaxID=1938954 RepID=A0A261Y349_9FUNG|nr:hypothetical protein BZG36_02638 [Bifiguratus adelaidae]